MSTKSLEVLLNAADNCIECIEQIMEYLDEAKALGVADIAGGMIAISTAKYAQIDKANAKEEEFEKWFRTLTDSPTKTVLDTKLYVEISDSMKAIDIFLDNIIVDLAVQAKISDAIKEGKSVRNKLEEIKRSIISRM